MHGAWQEAHARSGDPPIASGVSAATEVGPAQDLVDLNTATLAQLNALHGGGLIGRAIIRGRPYASPGDLLRKRVLNRAAYGRVKDQVTVR